MWLYLSILIVAGLELIVEAKIPMRSYCSVREAKFSYNFDFSELTSHTDYVVRHEEHNFLKLQICKPLKNRCNGYDDIAVCHYNGNKEFAIGKEPPKVAIEFGKTIFKYTGQKCKNNRNHTVNIEMICDFTAKETNKIKWVLDDEKDCEYNLQWRTINACSQRQQIKCSVDDKSGHYDLSSLINYSDNYEVFVSSKYLAVLNVCHTVLYRPNSCHLNNAACLVSSENPDDSKNLGTITEDLKYNPVNKSLTLRYTNGAMCTARNASINHMQTTINFFCDLDATDSLPEYIGGIENCDFQFKWITAAACSEEALKKKSSELSSLQRCSVKSPLTDYVFNLSSLMNREFFVRRFDTVEFYKFSVCSPLNETVCGAGSGVCQTISHVSGGVANSKLMWKETGPYLNYTTGAVCGRGNQQMYTVIEFYCDENENFEIEDMGNSCYDKIKMSTNLACGKSSLCVTYNKDVNLESLKRDLSNYVIKSPNSEYHINVCNPVAVQEGLNCPDGTAICEYIYKEGKLKYTMSLGYPNENLIRTSDRSAVLMYRNGSVCKENKKKRIESSISFLCDISHEIGTPNFTSYKDCTYFFAWHTQIVCGSVVGKVDEKNCTISNALGDVRDLSFLQDSLGPQYATNDRKVYNISICGRTHCKHGFICTNELNYGADVTVHFDYSFNLVRIHFTQGTKCEDGSNAKSSITLICREEDLSTKPVVVKEEPCNVEFEWYTSKICSKLIYQSNKSKINESTISHNRDAFKNEIKPNTTISKNKSTAASSNGPSGGLIVGIIFVVAFLAAAVIFILKRWKPSFRIFSSHVRF